MNRHFRKREWAIRRFRGRAFGWRGAPRRGVHVVFEGQHRAKAGVASERTEVRKDEARRCRAVRAVLRISEFVLCWGATVRF